LPFDVRADGEYGRIRSEAEASVAPIGGNDLLIGAHAQSTGATIVTASVAEFQHIPGLRVENWLACAVGRPGMRIDRVSAALF
jgi:tRNA(fMet)-specific endonuclease VapC